MQKFPTFLINDDNESIRIGNALVDILARISNDAILQELSLPKGSTQLVDEQNAEYVSNASIGLPKAQASEEVLPIPFTD